MGAMRNVRTFFVKKTLWKTENLGHLEEEGENTKVVLQEKGRAGVGGIYAANKRVQWRDVNTSMNTGSHKKGRIS